MTDTTHTTEDDYPTRAVAELVACMEQNGAWTARATQLARTLDRPQYVYAAAHFLVDAAQHVIQGKRLAAEREAVKRRGGDYLDPEARYALEERCDALRAEAYRRTVGYIRQAVEEEAVALVIDWMGLLDVTFLLDGESVAWGDATEVQHKDRLAMFMGNALGNIESATRHQAAINLLTSTRAATLREAVAL